MKNCLHEKWMTKKIPLSDGRPAQREFCVQCGRPSSGTNLGFALPMVRDADVLILSYKYPGKTLGEVLLLDREYLVWLMEKSNASDRIKKSARRLLEGREYVPHKEGEVYAREETYINYL